MDELSTVHEAIKPLIARREECLRIINLRRDEIHSLNKALYAFGIQKLKNNMTSAKWDGVDWTQNNSAIAEHLGCSRERVRQKRLALGIPDPDSKRKSKKRIVLENWISANRHLQGQVTLPQVMEMVGKSCPGKECVISVLKRAGFKLTDRFGKTAYVVQKINWSLPNKHIAEIWSMDGQYVANLRGFHKKGPAKWDWRTEPGSNRKLFDAIAREREKVSEMVTGEPLEAA